MPKGHLEPGESAEEAALREVREETGLQAEVLGLLGETSYAYRRMGERIFRPKRVIWYLMRPLTSRDGLQLAAGEGMLEAAWLDFEAARARLTWPGDRSMVERAATRLFER